MLTANKFIKLIFVFVLFLFAITTTGIYTWAPVITKNWDHHHDFTISVKSEHSSQWSLIHHDEQVLVEDTKNHQWKSYDEPPFHHSVKPIQAEEHFSVDPIFFLSFALPLILFFLCMFERPIRSLGHRKRQYFIRNSYTYSKDLIVLHN